MSSRKRPMLATLGLLMVVGIGSTTLGGCSSCPSGFPAPAAPGSAARVGPGGVRDMAEIDPDVDKPTYAPLTGPDAPSPAPSCNSSG